MRAVFLTRLDAAAFQHNYLIIEERQRCGAVACRERRMKRGYRRSHRR
jgi:hypothetical protein